MELDKRGPYVLHAEFAARVREVVDGVQWSGSYGCCPWCHAMKDQSHDADCKLAALLREIDP